LTDPEEPFGPARPAVRALPRRIAAALGSMIAALLVPDRGVPPLVLGGRYRLAMAIAVVAALLAAGAASARIDMAPSVLSPPGMGGPPGAGGPPAAAPPGPPGEDRTDREIAEEIEKQASIFRVKVAFSAGLGTPARIFLLAIGLYLLGRFVGGAPAFRRALAAASIAALPWAVRSIVAAAAAIRQRSITPEDLGGLVGGRLPVSSDNPLLAHVLGGVDLFSLWSVVLCVFGMAAAAGIGRARSAIAVIVGFALLLLLTAGMR
jgi:hypothetical protein